MMPIAFYSHDPAKYGWRRIAIYTASQISLPHPVIIDGVSYRTSEHYFQAMKFVGTASQSDVQNAATPADAARSVVIAHALFALIGSRSSLMLCGRLSS